MLLLTFFADQERYAINATEIEEIIPKLPTEKADLDIPFLLGNFNRHNVPIPLIDFALLIKKRATVRAYTSRTIILKNPQPNSQISLVGILGERVCEMVQCDPSQVQQITKTESAPFLTKTLYDDEGMVTIVDVPLLFQTLSKIPWTKTN